MFERGLIEPTRVLEFFQIIEDQLYKYPAIDPQTFRRSVEKVVADRLNSGNTTY